MESNLYKSNSICSSEDSYLPNNQRNEIPTGWSADDELSDTSVCEPINNTIKVIESQTLQTKEDCRQRNDYQINEIISGCSADDELSDTSLCKPVNTIKIKERKTPQTIEGCRQRNDYKSNEIATGCSADDELSDKSLCESLNTKIKVCKIPKIIDEFHQFLLQKQKENFCTESEAEDTHKTATYSCCACNPYDTVEEMISKLSITEGRKSTKSSNQNTCRLKNKCTDWVENEFTKKYGSYFNKDLVFAVDVLLLIRTLNGLSFRYIIFPTNNSAPKSPCDEKMDDALMVILKNSTDEFENEFDKAMKGKYNYKNFQNLLVQRAMEWETSPYEAKNFLVFCALIGQWSAYAETKDIERACDFAPLIICRTIHRLRLWTKIPPTFWKDLAEAAEELVETNS